MSEEAELSIIAGCFMRFLGDARAVNKALVKTLKSLTKPNKPIVKKAKKK